MAFRSPACASLNVSPWARLLVGPVDGTFTTRSVGAFLNTRFDFVGVLIILAFFAGGWGVGVVDLRFEPDGGSVDVDDVDMESISSSAAKGSRVKSMVSGHG